MNLSDSFTLMSLFTIESANCVSRSLVVKGLKMFICKHAWASTTDLYLTHEAVLPTTWGCLSILWGVSGTGRGIRLKNVLGDFDFLGMGTAVGLPWWRYEYKVNNFRHREARSQWGAKYKSQGDVFRHSDRDPSVLWGQCIGGQSQQPQLFEEWSQRRLDLEFDVESIPYSATCRDLTLAKYKWSHTIFVL